MCLFLSQVITALFDYHCTQILFEVEEQATCMAMAMPMPMAMIVNGNANGNGRTQFTIGDTPGSPRRFSTYSI